MRRTAGEELRANIAELADRETVAAREMWLVSLDEPTAELFATTADHSDVCVLAVAYANRIRASVAETDRADVRCVRTETPICVLGVPTCFMEQLIPTMRRNGVTGRYRKAGTEREYRF